MGNGWHETYTGYAKDMSQTTKDDCKDNGQYYHVLYCLGYGPLKVTDIKLNNLILAYNRTYKYDNNKETLLHGHLEGWKDDDTGDILRKWKNNDVEIDILQR